MQWLITSQTVGLDFFLLKSLFSCYGKKYPIKRFKKRSKGLSLIHILDCIVTSLQNTTVIDKRQLKMVDQYYYWSLYPSIYFAHNCAIISSQWTNCLHICKGKRNYKTPSNLISVHLSIIGLLITILYSPFSSSSIYQCHDLMWLHCSILSLVLRPHFSLWTLST